MPLEVRVGQAREQLAHPGDQHLQAAARRARRLSVPDRGGQVPGPHDLAGVYGRDREHSALLRPAGQPRAMRARPDRSEDPRRDVIGHANQYSGRYNRYEKSFKLMMLV